MGTVGLSFGSPTSGEGFNVTSTVSMIVANLQNVETPWNNQLSTLESQDTVLSNLGTLFSNVSTDMSALTDLTGSVFSLMEGSSSDDNIVDLTAASSSAVPGTYSVIVNSLATTAYGYVDPVASVDDTLTGSLSVTTGTGSDAVTTSFDMSSLTDQTITGLEDAINSADIGVTASIMTSADGSSLLITSNTSGSGGSVNATTDELTDTTAGTTLEYNPTLTTGADASLTVDGISVESASNTATGIIPGATIQLLSEASGTTVDIVIANDTTDVESAVYDFVTDYNSLVSAMNAQETTDSSGDAEPLFGSPTLSLLQEQLLSSINYQNPSGYLTAVSSASDTLTGSITIGSTTIDVPAAGSGENNIDGLAAAINSADVGVTANVVDNGSGPQLALVPNTDGASISVTSNLTDATSGASLSYTSNSGGINALTDLGISMNDDGTLSLNETSLDSVLSSNYSGVVAFFQDANSWGSNLTTVLNDAGTSDPDGLLALAESSNSSTESTLNTEISNENSNISTEQVSLTAELNSANEILQELPTQLQGLNELYSAVTGYNEDADS